MKHRRKPSVKKNVAPYLATVVVILVILAAAIFFQLPSASTSSPLPPLVSISALIMPSNVLYGLPMQQLFLPYYSNSTSIWGHTQYAYSFTGPLFNASFVPPDNYTINVPSQYANLTSPFGSVVSVWDDKSPSAALTAYGSRSVGMCSNINATATMRTTTSGIGTHTTYCNGVLYGSSVQGVMFVTGNYSAEVILFGVLHELGPSYLNTTAQHIYSQLAR